MIKFVACCLFYILIAVLPMAAQNQPPVTRVENVTDDYFGQVENVTDDYFGQKVADPYQWMENVKSDETREWMKAQAVYADAYLKQLPERRQFLKRLDELTMQQPSVGQLKRFGNYLYYFRRAANDNFGKIMGRGGKTSSAPPQVLFDLDKMSGEAGKSLQVGTYIPSPNGRLVAYSISAGGSEVGETRVMEAATGEDLGVLTGCRILPDSSTRAMKTIRKPGKYMKNVPKFMRFCLIS